VVSHHQRTSPKEAEATSATTTATPAGTPPAALTASRANIPERRHEQRELNTDTEEGIPLQASMILLSRIVPHN